MRRLPTWRKEGWGGRSAIWAWLRKPHSSRRLSKPMLRTTFSAQRDAPACWAAGRLCRLVSAWLGVTLACKASPSRRRNLLTSVWLQGVEKGRLWIRFFASQVALTWGCQVCRDIAAALQRVSAGSGGAHHKAHLFK